MSERDEADVPLQEVFKAKFGSGANTAERLKAERRAGRTPKERHRASKGSTRNVQINVRGTAKTKSLLEQIAELLDVSHADVIESAIEQFAKTHKLGG